MIEPRSYGEEPTLAETLGDPIIQQIMMSDGVTADDLMELVAVARRGSTESPEPTMHRIGAMQ